ncbi:MAG: proton-conducting transporter transmembrane domain-containing protein, partial [Acidimicrobiales bacterium]
GGPGDDRHDLEHYRGLSRRAPLLAGSFMILLVAQAGVPFTTGFLAKLEVVSASVGAGSTALAVIAMVSAAVAAFFYLRVVLVMYGVSIGAASADGAPGDIIGSPLAADVTSEMSGVGPVDSAGTVAVYAPPVVTDGGDATIRVPAATAVAIGLCLLVTVVFGLWPAPLVDFAHQAHLLF